MTCATLAAIGMHLASYHTAPDRNNVNPGLYATTECGLTAGVYYNSFERPSVYVGYVYDMRKLPVFATLAVATGYRNPVTVTGLVGARIDVGDARIRLGYVPKIKGVNAGHLVHLTLEWRL